VLHVSVTVESAKPLKLTIRPELVKFDRSLALGGVLLVLMTWINVWLGGVRFGFTLTFISLFGFVGGIGRALWYREVIEFNDKYLVLRKFYGKFELAPVHREYIDIELIEWHLRREFLEFGPYLKIEIHSKNRGSVKFGSGLTKKDLSFIRQQIRQIQPAILPKLGWNGIMKLERVEEQSDCPDSGAQPV
jgi:hypothetical protein